MNNIAIAEIPFLTESLTNNDHPIYDQQKSNAIHCFIASEKIKLTFNMNQLKPSEKFLNAVEKAINSNYPFCNLKNVFDRFGYICPCSIILGRTFSKIGESDNNDQFVNEYIDFSAGKDESRIVEEKLEKWNRIAKNLDTSFFLDFNGDIVKSNEIYFRLKSLEEKQHWKIITQDLIPLYKILPKDKQNEIESIVSDHYHIVMTGITNITHDNQVCINIQFECPLQDSDYEMFGCLIINEQNESDVMIRFSLANQYGCRATIHKLDTKSIPIGAQVFWIVLAKGHGYFSLHSRNIQIACGNERLTGQLPINVKIQLPTSMNPWLNSCFLVTGFDSKCFNRNQVIKSKLKDFSETCLSVEVFQYNFDDIHSEIKNLTMRWCIIDTHRKDKKDHITVDVGAKTLSLNFLGVLTSNVFSGNHTGIKSEKENHSHLEKISQKSQKYHEETHLRGEHVGKFGGPTTVAGQTLSAVQTVGDAITPFVPLFGMVTNILNQMLSIYENAKYRVEIAQMAVKSFQRKYQANEKKFRNQNYYYAWVRFVNVLYNIKKFSKEVTQLTNFQKFINANAVKKAFEKNIKEFEEVYSDLNFTMA
ncbi:22871_t:CDS:2, partial [Racocetra persica]